MIESNSTTYEPHEIAKIFPLIQGKEFDELCDDIEKHGLREPIWLYEGKILDGRNRAEACSITGVELRTQEYEGDDLIGFVLSLNLHRRHLNESQRGMVAANIANLDNGQHSSSANLQSTSRHEAAEKLNVSERTVNNAKKVQSEGLPELADRVNEGTLPVSSAAFIATLPEEEQREVASAENPKKAAIEKKIIHVTQNSGNDEWYTPAIYVEAARSAMGSIDLDPASCEIANKTVKATKYFDSKENGLGKIWDENVWLNPPYSSKLITVFIETVIQKCISGEVLQACVLVNNATETKWGQALLLNSQAVCFVSKRIKYLDETGIPKNTGLQGQMICYMGFDVASFSDSFKEIGVVLYGQ